MSRPIDLGDGHSLVLRTDVSMQELESILTRMQRFDPRSKMMIDNSFGAIRYAMEVLIEEWSVGIEDPPSGKAWRKLPAQLGVRVSQTVGNYINELQGGDKVEDFTTSESGSSSQD